INDGQNAHYDESCSSTLASTFSNGARDPSTGVATTDLYGKCTATHSGTSAAAPEAAGVFALALHANPNLTWRDIQHLTVLTSKRNSLYDAKARYNNGGDTGADSGWSGWVRGWSLVLHGTRAPPYAQLQPQDPHSKLAVVKKAHEDNALNK
ncbi:hypothetical protein O3G_MSEX014457, partial [Manduca sexta]